MSGSFFVPDGDRFVPTPWTRGPWSPEFQHAGPLSALVARAFESFAPPGLQIARFTLEIFRPIPVAPIRIEATETRPGKRVQYLEAVVTDDDGACARASAWRIRAADDAGVDVAVDPTPFASPADTPVFPIPELWGGPSYFTAMEWRFAAGTFFEPGPAAAWLRMLVPLVPDEEPSSVARALAAADSGNGISLVLRGDEWSFVNTELTVHLFREPAGDWVCLDATTRIDARGVGLAESVLWDERARIGSGRQSLYVGRRDEPPPDRSPFRPKGDA